MRLGPLQYLQDVFSQQIGGNDGERGPGPGAEQVDKREFAGRVFRDADAHGDDGPQTVKVALDENNGPAVFFQQQVGDGELASLLVELALDETLVETSDVKVDLVSGKSAEPGDENGHADVHVARVAHDPGHDQTHLAFEDTPDEEDDVAVFFEKFEQVRFQAGS